MVCYILLIKVKWGGLQWDWGRANLSQGLNMPICLIPLLQIIPQTIK